MMVGRTAELKRLQQLYQQEGNQLVVLYGQSDIGLDELISEFAKDKKAMFYAARPASPELQRRMLGEAIQEQYGITIQKWEYDTFFSRIHSGDSSKLVLVFWDCEHMFKNDPTFVQSIQRLKDKRLYPGPVMIILCSCSIAWAENDMIQCLGTCVKKVTSTMKLKELGFVDVVHMFPDYTVEQCVQVYGLLGGVPGYLKRWQPERSLKENVCAHILSPEGFLYQEAQGYIRESLRELSVYNTILEAIASGRHKLNELYQYTGYSRAKISVYLKNLMALDVVEKVIPFETGGWENAQKGLYQLKHTYLAFWYRFVYPYATQLWKLEPEEFYDRYIQPGLEEYLDFYFSKVCMEYLELMSLVGQLPIEIYKIGSWIGKKGQIDIVAQNSIREYIVGLCNWASPQLTNEMYQQLKESMKQARITAKHCYLFSAKAFDQAIQLEAQQDKGITLVDMTRL